MIIKGRNLGEQKVKYTPLSETELDGLKDDPESMNLLTYIEKTYFEYVEECKNTPIKPLQQKDGKVQLSAGMIKHNCSDSLETLMGIAQYGILASEWFGQYESEGEGLFCTFIDRIQEEDCREAKVVNAQWISGNSKGVTLLLDSSNPVMEKLLAMDFFKYKKEIAENPEETEQKHTEEELILLDTIDAISPGADMVIKGGVRTRNWSAIPGGIPSALVNGVFVPTEMINSYGRRPILEHDNEYIEEVSKLFPNATIFNGDLEVLHSPLNEQQENPDQTLVDDNNQSNEGPVSSSQDILSELIKYKTSTQTQEINIEKDSDVTPEK